MTATTASFSFTGEFFTNEARNSVLDGKWRKGYQFLIESFEGLGNDHAFAILKGTHALIGAGENIEMVESLDEEYQNDVYDIYHWNVFSDVGGKYKFKKLVTFSDINEDIQIRGLSFDIPESQEYVERYMLKSNEKLFVMRFGERTNNVDYLIAEIFDENSLPLWTTDKDISGSARNYYEKNLKKVNNHIPSVKQEAETEAKPKTSNIYREAAAESVANDFGFDNTKDFSNSLREKVLDAIKERGVKWETETVSHLGKDHQIRYPVDLAVAYALQRTTLSPLAPKWQAVSEPGLKLGNDSRLHTDLWLALGNDLDGSEYSYDEDHVSIFHKLMIKLQEKSFPAGEFYTLNSSGLKKFKGQVVNIQSEQITKNDILVIPHAGPEFQEKAMKAGLVICEVGGKLAHLAIVGREFGLPIIQMENACEIFKEQTTLIIDFETATITAQNY